MGCDIYLVLEKKNGDHWVGVNDFSYIDTSCMRTYSDEKLPHVSWRVRERNYGRFAALAGVRGEGPDPKGKPDDASDLTRMRLAEWGQDAHSTTWYPIREAISIFDRTSGEHEIAEAVTNKLTNEGHAISGAARWFNLDEESLEEDEYRVVIWFDN